MGNHLVPGTGFEPVCLSAARFKLDLRSYRTVRSRSSESQDHRPVPRRPVVNSAELQPPTTPCSSCKRSDLTSSMPWAGVAPALYAAGHWMPFLQRSPSPSSSALDTVSSLSYAWPAPIPPLQPRGSCENQAGRHETEISAHPSKQTGGHLLRDLGPIGKSCLNAAKTLRLIPTLPSHTGKRKIKKDLLLRKGDSVSALFAAPAERIFAKPDSHSSS